MLSKIKNFQQNSLAKEISIETRKEQIKTCFIKHKKTITYFSTAVLLLMIIVFAFNLYQKSQEDKYSAILQQVLIDTEKNNQSEAQNSLKQLYENTSVPSGVRSVASLKYGAILLNDGKIDEALNVYLATNKNSKFDPYIRELAGFLALKSMIDSGDKAFDEKIIKLEAELEKNSKVLKYFIIEQKAIFEWSHGNIDAADKIFKDLVGNPEVAESIKIRAKEMTIINSSKLKKDPIDAKEAVTIGSATDKKQQNK